MTDAKGGLYMRIKLNSSHWKKSVNNNKKTTHQYDTADLKSVGQLYLLIKDYHKTSKSRSKWKTKSLIFTNGVVYFIVQH